jgi:hypothetical protein
VITETYLQGVDNDLECLSLAVRLIFMTSPFELNKYLPHLGIKLIYDIVSIFRLLSDPLH